MRYIPIISKSQNTINICYDKSCKSLYKKFYFSSESDYATCQALVLTFLKALNNYIDKINSCFNSMMNIDSKKLQMSLYYLHQTIRTSMYKTNYV